MAGTATNSFDRVFSNRELLRGPARRVLVWSGLGSLVLVWLLFDLFLIADLLDRGGEMELLIGEVAEFERLTGEDLSEGEVIPPQVRIESRGIQPAVWWSRGTIWEGVLVWLNRRVPALRDDNAALMILVLAAVTLGVVRSLFLGRARTVSNRVALDAATRLRQTLHRQTMRLGPSDLSDEEGQGALSLFTHDVERVRQGVAAWVGRLGRCPLELLLLTLFMLSFHWRATLQCLFPLALCWYILERHRERLESARRLAAARTESELRLLAESFRKTRLIRGFAMEGFEQEQFQRYLDRYSQNVSSAQQTERWSQWASRLLILLCVAIVLYLLARKVLLPPWNSGSLSLSAALVLVTAFAAMQRPLEALWRLRDERDAASQAAERIYRYLNQIPEVGQAVGAKFLQPLSKSLQFENVSYALPNRRKLLDGLDLQLTAGGTYALVSMNRLECRAAAYLLPRFIEPQQGRLLIDGEDIAWVTLESLRAEVIYVGGGDAYFTGTVRENITCGNNRYSLQEITEAAKITHAHNFIVRMTQGYDTVLGEHGEQLDAGESFRLGLARAVLRNPALLIVEEPDADLEDDTKSMLDDAYNRLTEGRTVLFLPSRLSTLRRCDRIVFLHQGKVEGSGGHAELIKKVPLYRHWEYLRYNEFRKVVGEPA